MSRLSGVLILAVAVGCTPAGLPVERGGAPAPRYTVVVANDWTDMLAIAVLPQGPKVSLYPGERRTLLLSGAEGRRYRVAVSRGRNTYLTGIFIPSRARPCALVRINDHPRYIVPTGPVPCSWAPGRAQSRPRIGTDNVMVSPAMTTTLVSTVTYPLRWSRPRCVLGESASRCTRPGRTKD